MTNKIKKISTLGLIILLVTCITATESIYGGVDNIVRIDISFKNGTSISDIIYELELKYADLINSET